MAGEQRGSLCCNPWSSHPGLALIVLQATSPESLFGTQISSLAQVTRLVLPVRPTRGQVYEPVRPQSISMQPSPRAGNAPGSDWSKKCCNKLQFLLQCSLSLGHQKIL